MRLVRPDLPSLTLKRPSWAETLMRPALAALVLTGVYAINNGGGTVTGSASNTARGISTVASGALVITGSAGQTAAGMTQTAQGGAVVSGSASNTAQGLLQSASGSPVVSSSAASIAAAMESAGQGAPRVTGSAASTGAGMTTEANGGIATGGTASNTALGMSQSAAGTPVIIASAANTALGLSQSVVASPVITGSAAQTATGMSQTTQGAPVVTASAANTALGLSESAAGSPVISAVAANTAAGMTQSASGVLWWTPANLTTNPLVKMDAAGFTWSGSNFSSGTNTGSIGGTYAIRGGTPTKAAADANGYDAIAFAGTSGIYLSAATTPGGNLFILYVSKKTGTQPGKWGLVAGQANASPGWYLADLVQSGGTLPSGQTYANGDRVMTSTATPAYDIIVTPAAETGYNINTLKVGTERFWHINGATQTEKNGINNTRTGTSSTNLTIGLADDGGLNSYWNANLAYLLIAQDPTTTEVEKLEGWAAWKYNLVSKLPSGHPYKTVPPYA